MEEAGVSAAELAELRDVSVQAVYKWIRTGQIAREHLPSVAAKLKTTADFLLTGITLGDGVRTYHPDDEPDPDTVFIKESTIRFAAGNGHKVHIELVEDSEPATYRLSWFAKERMNPKRCGRFRIIGRSQEPFLFPGDTILVNFDETDIKNECVYALRYDDELRVKKIRKNISGLTLISWNDREHPPEFVPADKVDEHITIIGRVRDKSGRGGL